MNRYSRSASLSFKLLLVILVVVFGSSALFHPSNSWVTAQENLFCGLNQVQISGQEWVYPGAGSNVTLDQAVIQNDGVVDISAEAQGIALTVPSTNNTRVLVLVLDDFTNPDKTTGLPHGKVVYEIAFRYLSKGDPSNYILYQLNIPDYDLTGIDTILQNEIIDAAQLGYTHVVLNMSFAFIPCDFVLPNDKPVSVPSFLEAYNLSDSIIEYDLSPTEVGFEARWQVAYLQPDGGLQNAGLQLGDVITGFGEACTPYNRGDLWNQFMAEQTTAGSNVPICVERLGDGFVTELPALNLFTAVRGYSLAQALAGEPDPDLPLAEYENSIRANLVTLATFLSTSDQSDLLDLGQWARDAGSQSNITVIPVAAAGNYGQPVAGTGAPTPTPTPSPVPTTTPSTGSVNPDPFLPGRWGSVISVSGSSANAPLTIWPYSNRGEVMAPAIWYKVGSYYVGGTSFAAPAVSAMIAHFVIRSSSCDFTPLMDKAFDDEYFVDALTNACQP